MTGFSICSVLELLSPRTIRNRLLDMASTSQKILLDLASILSSWAFFRSVGFQNMS